MGFIKKQRQIEKESASLCYAPFAASKLLTKETDRRLKEHRDDIHKAFEILLGVELPPVADWDCMS